MNFFKNNGIKVFIVLLCSFLISDISIKNVFLAQSPKVNPMFVPNTIAKVKNSWSKTGNFIASINLFPKINKTDFNQTNYPQPNSFALTKSQFNEILKTPLKQVSQGVYAGESGETKVYEVRVGEIDYLEYTFNINGKEVKVKVPKNQEAPSQQEVEEIFNK